MKFDILKSPLQVVAVLLASLISATTVAADTKLERPALDIVAFTDFARQTITKELGDLVTPSDILVFQEIVHGPPKPETDPNLNPNLSNTDIAKAIVATMVTDQNKLPAVYDRSKVVYVATPKDDTLISQQIAVGFGIDLQTGHYFLKLFFMDLNDRTMFAIGDMLRVFPKFVEGRDPLPEEGRAIVDSYTTMFTGLKGDVTSTARSVLFDLEGMPITEKLSFYSAVLSDKNLKKANIFENSYWDDMPQKKDLEPYVTRFVTLTKQNGGAVRIDELRRVNRRLLGVANISDLRSRIPFEMNPNSDSQFIDCKALLIEQLRPTTGPGPQR